MKHRGRHISAVCVLTIAIIVACAVAAFFAKCTRVSSRELAASDRYVGAARYW